VALKEMVGNDQWKMATPSDGLLKGKWWEIFGDPQLNRLEELVSVNNQNVKLAEAQFRQARALVAANHANYYPTIDHAKRRRKKYRQGQWHQSELFVTRNRDVGAGPLGPGSFVGGECGE
jgi:outer membrane protein TolC